MFNSSHDSTNGSCDTELPLAEEEKRSALFEVAEGLRFLWLIHGMKDVHNKSHK
jgi:hypothetical protein